MKKPYILIIAFVLIGAIMIKCSLNTNFAESEDRKSFGSAMVSWFKQLGSSTKNTAEYAVKEQDWLPNNETIQGQNKSEEGEVNESN